MQTPTLKRPLSTLLTNNAKMHDRNPYKNNPPNFTELAKLYPSFSSQVIWKNGKATVDWNNPKATCELTKALLHKDFHLDVEIPADQLCPTITSRLNYILWLEDLLGVSPSSAPSLRPTKRRKETVTKEIPEHKEAIRGIDIGTGASCIYPLLAVSCHQNWSFIATDIDHVSTLKATENVLRNRLEDKIQVIHLPPSSPSILLHLFPDLKFEKAQPHSRLEPSFDFCMCNPPFFACVEAKKKNPRTHCNATKGELVTEGGELGFVTRMAEESMTIGCRIGWYTSLLGRKVNVKKALSVLHSLGIPTTRTTTFFQGRTTRWAIAWSFLPALPEIYDDTKLFELSGSKTFSFSMNESHSSHVLQQIESALRSREISWNSPETPFFMKASVYFTSLWFQEAKYRDNDEEEEEEEEEKEKEEEEEEKEEEKENQKETTMVGPWMPPRLGFSFNINILQTSSREFNVTMQHTAGQYLTTFAFLYLDLKAELEK